MTLSTLRLGLAAVALMAPGPWIGGAAADCLRRVYNRSPYVLVASQDGGPGITVLPGRSVPLRLARPGRIDLAVSCGAGPGAERLAQAQFSYAATLDRCYIEFGTNLFVRELGRGFFGLQGTAPFTLNNPAQGDIVLGPFPSACPVLSRGG